jgi:RNA polymerase sigma-70 factor (ECF subfamily)
LADGGVQVSGNDSIDWQQAMLRQAQRGDVRAFERLYRDTIGRVHGVCLRLTRDPALAEDCTQEAYLRAWKALPEFEARSSLATWLHRIAVNVVLERRRRRSPDLDFVEELPEDSIDVQLDTPLEEREIEAAIAGLPDGARDVLVLCAIYGYTHGEAGAMLGIAEGTCKAQLHRARHLLRTRLGGQDE